MPGTFRADMAKTEKRQRSQMANSHLPAIAFARSHWSLPEAQFLPVLYLPRWQQS